MKVSVHFSAIVASLLFISTSAPADSPLPPPAKKQVCSPNQKVCAIMDPEQNLTRVMRGKEELWSMTGWFRVAAIADDGDHLVTGYGGINLLSLDASASTIMLTFIRRGQIIQTTQLDEIINDLSNLRPTVSHLHWGNYIGFDQDGFYVIETVENLRLSYDVTTGQLAKSSRTQ